MLSPCRDCMERTKDGILCRTACARLDAFKKWLMGADITHKAIDTADQECYKLIWH